MKILKQNSREYGRNLTYFIDLIKKDKKKGYRASVGLCVCHIRELVDIYQQGYNACYEKYIGDARNLFWEDTSHHIYWNK